MNDCYFCTSIAHRKGLDFLEGVSFDHFVVSWDAHPVTPGHALVIPKRHAQYMRELNTKEKAALIDTVLAVKQYILDADLSGKYQQMHETQQGTKSEAYLAHALKQLQAVANRSPDAFNDGLNDGPAAGQTMPHFHWHVLPRWDGDMLNPRGGIRHMFPGMGNYQEGISK
jgi:diadenosine tetraphosphate (Ap4A) HIT family hydrolase